MICFFITILWKYSEASAFLGMILHQPGCSNDVLMALASKAVNVFGPPADWTPAVVKLKHLR